jgi:tRNA threonylcarbamoyladenosine biosynthesis protein TsaB
MLLAIDTSTSSVGIAIFDGSTILGETTWVSTNRHTTILAKAVKQMFEDIEIDQSGL